MIYSLPAPNEPLDQGDILDGCPVASVTALGADAASSGFALNAARVVVVTQTCDFAQEKIPSAVVAVVFDAQFLIESGIFKPADVKGPVRAARTWGWYFLPADAPLGLPEMIADFRRLHTVKLDVLRALCAANQRRGRVQPLYREHLNKHLADTYSRIGLPRPYETL